ncbi:MAG: hypothetical protein ACRENE_23450, partial [Polyangiaceae bacterium]
MAAANVCFPATASVPFESGPPSWYVPAAGSGASAGASFDIRVNEPRWSSDAPQRFANDSPTPSNGDYRVVASSDFSELTVSVQNTRGFQANSGTSAESVYLFFYVPASGTTAASGTGVRIALKSGSPDPYFYPSAMGSSGIVAANVSKYTYSVDSTGTITWTELTSTVPSWVEPASIASWTEWDLPAGATQGQPGPNSGSADWAVQFKVNLAAAGIQPGTAFKMAVCMHMSNNA